MQYIDSVLNYMGSKFKLLPQILPLFDVSKPKMVDLFAGGGSVFINSVEKFDEILVNDIIPELIGIHKGLIDSDEIIEATKKISPPKDRQDIYLILREEFNQKPTPEKLWALILSCNSNMMRFNKKFEFNQTWGKRSWNSNTDKKVEALIKHIRKYKDKFSYTHRSFKNVPITENTFFYIDPPYGYIVGNDGNIANKQISEAGYNSYYSQLDDIHLLEYCRLIDEAGSTFMVSGVLEHNGKTSWLLKSLIDKGYKYKELDCNYDKINKSGIDKKTVEIIVMNY